MNIQTALAWWLLVLITISSPMANAAPSKGKALTACKNKIYEVLGSDSRVKFRKYRRSGLTFTVSTGEGRRAIRCVFDGGMAELFENGKPVRK